MTYQTSLKRLQLLRGHVSPSVDAKRERKTSTFNLPHAQEKVWATLPESYFQTYECLSELHGTSDPSFYVEEKDTMRKDTNILFIRLTNKMFEKGYTTPEKIAENIDAFNAGITAMMPYDYACVTKYLAHYGLYVKTIKNLGTERHRELLLDGCSLRTLGAYCLTELGHGSNVRGLETTAVYDKETQEFIINSPQDTSMKYWIGNLGKTATNAIVFAQLFVEGENKGVHAFCVEIRSRTTHLPHPGIQIGDCGTKIGLNGMDNGWMMFNNYRVPRETLLNKFGDVTPEGVYTSTIKSEGKRFANSIASLTGGRVIMSRIANEHGLNALTIALRYAAVRRQFGPTGKETLLLDYPLHQSRLIPRFADHFINFIAGSRLIGIWLENLPKLLVEGNNVTTLCHGLSSNMKSWCAWDVQDTIAECRRACGGNGYSHYALFGTILSYNDLHSTWEGDGTVLLQQTQKFLLSNLQTISKGGEVLETLDFLKLNRTTITEYTGTLDDISALQQLFRDRASYATMKAAKALSVDPKEYDQTFLDLQPFELKDMCLGYHETYGIDTFVGFLNSFTCEPTKKVFTKLLLLHILSRMVRSAGYFSRVLGTEKFGEVKTQIGKLLKDLRKEIISLTDVLPFPNRAYGPLGNEDLQVYERFIQHFKSAPKVTERADWWKLAYANSEQKA